MKLGWPHGRQAVLTATKEVQSFLVYADRLPAQDPFEDANLIRIVYPGEMNVRDISDVRQGLARFLGQGGGSFGNCTSKSSLLDIPLGLDRAIKPVPVVQGVLDFTKMAAENRACKRFHVVGYDAVQVPIVSLVYVRK